MAGMTGIEYFASEYVDLSDQILQNCMPDRVLGLESREAAWWAQYPTTPGMPEQVSLSRLHLTTPIGSLLLQDALIYADANHELSRIFAHTRLFRHGRVGTPVLRHDGMGVATYFSWRRATSDDYRRAVAELAFGQGVYRDLYAMRRGTSS